ncbi:hypothetical protein RF11_02999 [Thelohanellus kitauei]|uniref:Uncharacterized protein n=1 Tax=Thelohanellus kitauei TaxID=669202 RepID=A0A0C2J2K7_THEKT|nr:hypothetical protein RF11_02999 [Thelohanellus kitauei]
MYQFDLKVTECRKDSTELYFELRTHDGQTAQIICNSSISHIEIEISGCKLKVINPENSFSKEYSIGYTFKLNKNIKYKISHFKIIVDFSKTVDKNTANTQEERLEMMIYMLKINFENNDECDIKGQEEENIFVDFNSNTLIYPCKSDEAKSTSDSSTLSDYIETNLENSHFMTDETCQPVWIMLIISIMLLALSISVYFVF